MHLKDTIRLSLGSIQSSQGNNQLLQWLSDRSLKLYRFLSSGYEGEIWIRNSSIFNAQIPFLSDIDITLIKSSTNGARAFLKLKKTIPIIGEINFYHPRIEEDLLTIANPYELMRDPILCDRFKTPLQLSEAKLISFFVRQLQSDQKWLVHYPFLREKKWKYLAAIMNKQLIGVPHNSKLISFISDSRIRQDIAQFIETIHAAPDLFKAIENESWKYLWPQAYGWNLSLDKNIEYLNSLDQKSLDILLEQIKWEFWGIGCHYYWLDKQSVVLHLERMLELFRFIDPSQDTAAMERILRFIQEENPSNR